MSGCGLQQRRHRERPSKPCLLRSGRSSHERPHTRRRAGLLNCYFWLDPVSQVTGTLFTKVLPFYDERVVALYGEFERGLYAGLA